MDLAEATETGASINNNGAKRLADEAIPAGSQKRRRIINSESSSSDSETEPQQQEKSSSSPLHASPAEKTLSTAASTTSRKRFAIVDSDSE